MDELAYAASSYLSFRWILGEDVPGGKQARWPGGSRQLAHAEQSAAVVQTDSPRAIREQLTEQLANLPGTAGLLLSGGIDSAILAALLPPGTRTYTIEFVADGAASEAPLAARYAERWGHAHQVVRVGFGDVVAALPMLMAHKGAPLHPVEAGLHAAARLARADGLTHLVVGNGADSNFGGLDKLLSRDWTVPAFRDRYRFVDPERALVRSHKFDTTYAAYGAGVEQRVDVPRFLREVHGPGITLAFRNALESAGIQMLEPYERMAPSRLDLGRIRAGQSKYLLRELFCELFSTDAVPAKLAFVRPMDRWLSDWAGPRHPVFRADLSLADFAGEQRWLLYCLDAYLELSGVRK